MIYPIANPTENQMIALANEMHQLSGGMCQAGAGPYGIGVSTDIRSPIGLFFSIEPDPFQDDQLFPDEISEYTVTVAAFWRDKNECLTPDEMEQLPQSSNPGVQTLTKTLLHLKDKSWTVSSDQYREAFQILADAELLEMYGWADPNEQGQTEPELGM